ncbi:MAG TPA: GIY-YIG nuclease family protein [Coleofasciculaceae cyanobacterium]|jgi:putative endonuclease
MGDDAAYTYLLECADGTLYAGWTTDPQKRLQVHNQGNGAKYTRTRLPVKLAGLWRFDTRTEAMRFEIKLKSLSRAQKLKLLTNGEEPDPHRIGL